MKRYLIISDHPDTNPVFSDALDRAKQYALEMINDVPEGTPVHVFAHHSQVTKSLVWNANPSKTKLKTNGAGKAEGSSSGRVHKAGYPRSGKLWSSADDAMLVRMLERGDPKSEIARTLGRTEKGVDVRISRMRLANKAAA